MAYASALWPLQTALFKLLSEDTYLRELVNGVFDGEAPATVEEPYVVIGEWTEIPNDLLAKQGRYLTVTLHIWSKVKGFQESKQICDYITLLLDRQRLDVEDWHNVSTTLDLNEAFMDVESTRHIIMRFRFRMSMK